MDHSPSPTTTHPFTFQGKKRLKSQDRIWIVTDVQSYTQSLYHWSSPQQWFRAGGIDLDANADGMHHLVIAEWTTDDMKAILKAGMAVGIGAPPWRAPLSHGFELTRIYHGDQEKGRFREKVALIDLDPELKKQGAMLRSHFERTMGLRGNSNPGMWQSIVDWAVRENAIEAAALSLEGWFAAKDVKKVVGDINVTPSLSRMVKDGLLISNGKAKKGSKYMRAVPRPIERADWTG